MCDKEIFVRYLEDYKKDFPTWWSDEKYKWEMVKHFQDNFDPEAKNFPEMLKKSLSKTENLLAGNHYLPRSVILNTFAKNEPETVRKMFREIYDEKIEIFERIKNFKSKSEKLFEKYGTEGEGHHQKERAISTYLWLRYPDKYYIYKFTDLQKITRNLNSDFEFVRGDYEHNIRIFYRFYDEICEELKKDDELIKIFKSQLNKNCYPDSELKTLTQDFGFYISKH